MVYIVIGIMLIVAVGALMTQRSRRALETQETLDSQGVAEELQSTVTEADVQTGVGIDIADVLSLSPDAEKRATETRLPPQPETPPPPQPEAEFKPEEDVIPLKPILAAEPLSSPHALNSATYTSAASQAAGDSPYAYGNTIDEAKPKPETTLLRWSGKTGSLQIGDLTIRGPVAYWSDGPSSTSEPSCIDIKLPVEFPIPGGENEIPSEGAASYNEMTPLQRGVYLRWLAEGRMQPPPHACYPLVWFFGLERRVLVDRLDMGICISEAFRLLPFLRWESLRQGLIKYITWLAAKLWLPEEEILAFSRSLASVPKEILNMLLRPYADSRLPLPSVVAFTIMRASSLAAENGLGQSQAFLHSDDLLMQFAAKYKAKCAGGLILVKPKASVFVAYAPTNPTLIGDKKLVGGVLELPDFFKDTENFAPLIAAWKEFLKDAFPAEIEPLKASDELEARPDWDSFVRRIQGLPDAVDSPQDEEGVFSEPVMTNLSALADLVGIAGQKDGKKIEAADRKKISDAARVEGFLIIPHMGIAGKEYLWNEPVVLTPFPPGDRLSQDYSAAALTLEYACALTGLSDPHTLEIMRGALGDYFSLSSEDYARLEALSSVLASSAPLAGETAESRMDPNNLGESMQFWLQQEQRVLFGNFMVRFLSGFSVPEQSRLRIIRVLRESLNVEAIHARDANAEEEAKEVKLELGNKVVQALSPLFTD